MADDRKENPSGGLQGGGQQAPGRQGDGQEASWSEKKRGQACDFAILYVCILKRNTGATSFAAKVVFLRPRKRTE